MYGFSVCIFGGEFRAREEITRMGCGFDKAKKEEIFYTFYYSDFTSFLHLFSKQFD